MAKRCVVNGCNGWQAVGVLLCRQHANDPAALRTADIHKNLDTYLARPAQYQLMCYTQTGNPMHLALEEGEAVDVLEIDPQGMCLCRTAAGAVGFYPRADLLTEDEVYQRFIAEEDARLQAELEARKQAQDKEAEAYEAQLREKMKIKAQADRQQRALEAEQRRAEAERLEKELEFKRQWDAEQAAKRAEEEKQILAAIAAHDRELAAKREKEAREQKKAWDAQEEAMRRAKEEAALPQWKRDLVAKRRASQSQDTTVFPGAAPR